MHFPVNYIFEYQRKNRSINFFRNHGSLKFLTPNVKYFYLCKQIAMRVVLLNIADTVLHKWPVNLDSPV